MVFISVFLVVKMDRLHSIEIEAPAADNMKLDKNGLYRFKDDVSNSREFLNILKRDEKENTGQTNQTASQAQPNRVNKPQTAGISFMLR